MKLYSVVLIALLIMITNALCAQTTTAIVKNSTLKTDSKIELSNPGNEITIENGTIETKDDINILGNVLKIANSNIACNKLTFDGALSEIQIKSTVTVTVREIEFINSPSNSELKFSRLENKPGKLLIYYKTYTGSRKIKFDNLEESQVTFIKK